MNIILLGAPGAGKGTQAEFITKRFGIPMISTGNLLREAINNCTELGLRAKEIIESGKLVPDDVIVGMVKERLTLDAYKKGCIFDGFPRTIPQAEELDKIADIDVVLSIEVPDEIIESRMSGRRVCTKCGYTYHIANKPPEVENVCDNCKGDLIMRKDDSPEVVRSRLHTYHEQTEPLKGYYEKQGKLKMIVGAGDIKESAGLIEEAIGHDLL